MPDSPLSANYIPLPGPTTLPWAYIPGNGPVSPQKFSQSSTNSPPSTATSTLNKFDFPWKFEGYKAFSAWMASEDDFFIFRRFESLNIEEKLEGMHSCVEGAPLPENLINSRFRWDEKYMQGRHALMGELSCSLHHYNQYIEAFSKVRARPRAEDPQINNVVNWLKRGAIGDEEASFITKSHDLISINLRTRPPLGRWLESLPSLQLLRPFRTKSPSNPDPTSRSTSYSSNTIFDRFTNTAIILASLTMLLAPMWWLEYVNSSESQLKIITGFVGVMMCATVNRPFEAVASAAAYAAVLMVFMQIDGKGSA